MTLHDFQQAADRYDRANRALLWPMLGTLAACLVTVSVLTLIEGPRPRGESPSLIGMALLAVIVVVGIGSVIPISRRIERTAQVRCPHCNKPIAAFRGLVTASKCCPGCGARVIDS